jgi:hypothetical protein
MKRALYLACAAICIPGIAQQGHPLTGTWSGDRGTTPAQRNQVTVVMNWDGKNVTGLINPGPDSIPISSVVLDVAKWTVRIEANGKDHIIAEGKIEDLGSYHRTIKGTWTQGTSPSAIKGDFKITRD